ncbi:Protein associated with UVRAG as autophagy enhancer, partial [Dissostichus eleginoides]
EELQQDVSTKGIEKLCLSSSVLMGGCVGISPSEHTHRYISWCVDSAETHTPEDTLEILHTFSVRKLVLDQFHFSFSPHQKQPLTVDVCSQLSRPVLSRRFRPVSWDKTSPPLRDKGKMTYSSMDSSPLPAAGSQRGGISMKDLGSKSTCAIGEKGLAEEQRGRGLISHDAPPSTEIFRSFCDLDKENAHFVVVDLMLEVLEGVNGFEDGGVDSMQRDSLKNAVALAEQLVLEFRRHFPSQEVRANQRAGNQLGVQKRSEVVALQHFLCAGCGTELERRYIKKLRYCDYLGRYFCECCHGGSEAVIPGRVLTCWDFNRYPVSDFSKQLLDSLWFQPLFHLQTLNSRVKELERFREVQDQLMDIQKLLNTCRLSSQRHPFFSLDDLQRLKKGQLGSLAKTLLHTALKHVESCELCLARGFICEFCRENNVIFPFQRETCRRCAVCRACFHKHCFVEKRCPKCERIKSRRKHPDGSTK